MASAIVIAKLIEDLSPMAILLIKALANRLRGVPDAEVAQMALDIDAKLHEDIMAELAKLPPKA